MSNQHIYYFNVSSPEQVVASTDKNQRRSFTHSYNIYNKGPSPLFTGKTNYVIPAVSTAGGVLVPINTYEVTHAIELAIWLGRFFLSFPFFKAKQRKIQIQKKTFKKIIWHAHTMLRFCKKFCELWHFIQMFAVKLNT